MLRKALKAAFFDQVIVFDPRAEALTIRARLKRHHVPDNTRFCTVGDEVGRVGVAQAQARAGMVRKAFCKTVLDKLPTNRLVYVTADVAGLEHGFASSKR